MGIVNSLKTGNVLIDMVFAMIIPIVIGLALNFVAKIQSHLQNIKWSEIFGVQKTYHERRIHLSTLTSSYRTTDLGNGDAQNEVLIKAVQLYLDLNGIIDLQSAKLELQQIGDGNSKNSSYYDYYDYDRRNTNTLADTLSKYRVVKKPLRNVWLDLGQYGESCSSGKKYNVFFLVEENMEDIKNTESVQQKRDLTLHFRSEGKDSIDAFIDQAYRWYLEQLRSLEDNSRYLYELKSSSSREEDNENSDSRRYKRYKLSEEKTFDSLFFKEKESLLKIVDNFVHRKGKYAIKGYPYKLGLLLHGPPGTGKTSLIKALAQLTGRSIVNVPLARISSNAELASLFFDHNFTIDGERIPVNLGFDNIIFVMEDVDALSKVVRRRDGKTFPNVSSPLSPRLGLGDELNSPSSAAVAAKNMWSMILGSTNEDCQELVDILIEKSERLRDAASDPLNLCLAARKISSLSGLRLVGEESENEAASKIALNAVKEAQKQLEHQEVIDEFLGKYAKSLINMIGKNDALITEEFENELLGLSCSSDDTCHFSNSFASLEASSVSSNTSQIESSHYLNYADDENHMDHQHLEDLRSQFVESKSASKSGLMESKNGAVSGGGCVSENEKGLLGMMGPSGMPSFWKGKRDELNLSGLLNVLDGVVDTPGRIVVMTTNHPEILDPALIRPGRIDKILLLGYLECDDLVKMVEHYFQVQLSDSMIRRLQEAVSDPYPVKLAPAQVEQLACEYDEVEDLIHAIENMKIAPSSCWSRKKNKQIT